MLACLLICFLGEVDCLIFIIEGRTEISNPSGIKRKAWAEKKAAGRMECENFNRSRWLQAYHEQLLVGSSAAALPRCYGVGSTGYSADSWIPNQLLNGDNDNLAGGSLTDQKMPPAVSTPKMPIQSSDSTNYEKDPHHQSIDNDADQKPHLLLLEKDSAYTLDHDFYSSINTNGAAQTIFGFENLHNSAASGYGANGPSSNRLMRNEDSTRGYQNVLPSIKISAVGLTAPSSRSEGCSSRQYPSPGLGLFGHTHCFDGLHPQHQQTSKPFHGQVEIMPFDNEVTEVISKTTGRGFLEPNEAAAKKSRFEARNSSPPSFKPGQVRKQKLGDRISTLQQLVAPFCKTDMASVLAEATECIKFLHSHVETLSVPYMKSTGNNTRGKNRREIVRVDTTARDGRKQEPRSDLRSRGLCLVPVACMSYLTARDDQFNVCLAAPAPVPLHYFRSCPADT